MITLSSAYPVDLGLRDIMSRIRPHWSEYQAVARVQGDGPWDEFLLRHPLNPKRAFFTFKDGREMLSLHPRGQLNGPGQSVLYIAAQFCIESALQIRSADEAHCCLILREHAYVLLEPNGPNRYVPLPSAGSAHELLEDPARLQAEFPGIFTFAD